MQSSLFSTIVSILAIFIIIMVAIVDIENTAVRKTFSPNFHNGTQSLTEQSEQKSSNSAIQNRIDQEIKNNENKEEITKESEDSSKPTKKEIIYSGSNNSLYPVLIKSPENEIQYKLNFEIFQRAGLTSFSLQRKPFNGTLFHDFHTDELATLNVNQQTLIKTDQETQLKIIILESWEFKGEDKQMADEIYTLLKNKFIGSLGVSINETNQFGQQSFYVNFEDKSENVFLIVKQIDSVYALSYLKDTHDLIKALFKLI